MVEEQQSSAQDGPSSMDSRSCDRIISIGHEKTKKRGHFGKWLTAILLVVLVFNIIVFLTYPINVGFYDYQNYLKMMMEGSSYLLHASGYPATLHLLFQLFSIAPAGGQYLNDIQWLFTIQKFQLGLHIFFYLVTLWLCYKSYRSIVTLLFALSFGTCIVFVNQVNTAGPEWLQGYGVIISLLLSAYAGTLNGYRKTMAYTISAAMFAIAYLVKFNSLLLAPAMLGYILFDKNGWHFKAAQIAASGLVFCLVVSIYASEYHCKSAGTKQLSFDHAWVLTTSLPHNYLIQDPENMGINTLRYVSLIRITPTDWSKLDWGRPGDFLDGYREKYHDLMALKRDDLISIVKASPLPPEFTAFNSSLPLYNYYGKERANKLGILVYIEALRDHPSYYVKRVASGLWKTFREIPADITVPTYSNSLGSSFTDPDFSMGVIRILPPKGLKSPYFAPYYNPTEVGSIWGIKFIDTFNKLKSSSILYFLFNLVVVFGLFKGAGCREKRNGIILIFGLLSFVSASFMIVGMRFKEVVAIAPVYFLLSSIGVAGACRVTWMYVTKQK